MKKLQKTRENIVSVASDLFSRVSFYKTTMEDVAKASKVGRRTVYTHFRSKEELYHAVIAYEISRLHDGLREVVNEDLPPDIKLHEYVFRRFSILKSLVNSNPAIRKDFMRNLTRVQNMRKELDEAEKLMLTKVIDEGNNSGVFHVSKPSLFSFALLQTLKGLEVPFIGQNFNDECMEILTSFHDVLMNGVKLKPELDEDLSF